MNFDRIRHVCAEKYGWDFRTTNNQPYLSLLRMLNSLNEQQEKEEQENNPKEESKVITGLDMIKHFGG